MGCCLSKIDENEGNCSPNENEEFRDQCPSQNLNEDIVELGADDNDSGKCSFLSFSKQVNGIVFNFGKSFL